jgi:hypothetical protein
VPDSLRGLEEADAILMLNVGRLGGGPKPTVDCCAELGKPYLVVDLDSAPSVDAVLAWLGSAGVKVLNVAAPRASAGPRAYPLARAFLLGPLMIAAT